MRIAVAGSFRRGRNDRNTLPHALRQTRAALYINFGDGRDSWGVCHAGIIRRARRDYG
jgi:hypothetical protein